MTTVNLNFKSHWNEKEEFSPKGTTKLKFSEMIFRNLVSQNQHTILRKMFSFHSYSTGIQSEVLAPFLECIFIQIHSFIL